MSELIAGLLHRSAMRRWDRALTRADTMEPEALKKLRARARTAHQRVDRVLQAVEGRIAANSAVARPLHADWAWRPDAWCRPLAQFGIAAVASKSQIAPGMRVFHDCPLSEVTVRQIVNTRTEHVAARGVRADVFTFDGSFLSFALDLPIEATQGITRRHIIRMDLQVQTERPLELFGRLNVRHGPNVEQLVREIPGSEGNLHAEFDLAEMSVNEARVERGWIDIIFEAPDMNQILLHDVTLSRRLRASF